MSGRHLSNHTSNGLRRCNSVAGGAAPKSSALPVRRQIRGKSNVGENLGKVDGVPRFRNNGRLTTGERPELESLEPVELLTRFHDDNDNGAFEELMSRYGGMVFSTCRRVLRDDHEAEDVTQATFLMLASRHKATQNVHKVGPWLRKVSHRLSLDALRTKKRRLKRENDRPVWNEGEKFAEHNVGIEERRQIVRECIDDLPLKYRMPVILFHFGGMSRDEIAEELGCRANTLGVRLHRARNMLAKALEARGVTMAGIAMTALLTDAVRTAIGSSMMQQTSVAAGELAAGGGGMSALVGSEISSKVLALTQSTAALSMGKVKMMTLAFAGASTILTGGGFAAHYAGASESMYDVVEKAIDRSPRLFDVQNFLPSWTTQLPSMPTFEVPLQVGMKDADDEQPKSATPGNPSRLPAVDRFSLEHNPFIANLTERRQQWNVDANRLPALDTPAPKPAKAAVVLAQAGPKAPAARPAEPGVVPPAKVTPVQSESALAQEPEVAAAVPPLGNTRSRLETESPDLPAGEAPTEVAVVDPPAPSLPTPVTPEPTIPQPAPAPSAPTLPPAPTQIIASRPAPELLAVAGTELPPTHGFAAVLPAAPAHLDAIVQADLAPPTSVLPAESLFDHPVDPLDQLAPPTPGHHKFIGMWDVEGQALAYETPSQFGSVEIAVPYDPDAAAATGVPIERLKLWAYSDADGWQRIFDESLYHDISQHVIGGRIALNSEFIGVSFPEPAVLGLFATGAALLLPRRRR